MSIVGIRESMEKKGCQIILWVIGGLVLIGMVTTNLRGFGGQGGENQAEKTELFSIGGTPVSVATYDADVKFVQSQNQGATLGAPGTEFMLTGQALSRRVKMTAIVQMAKERGIVLDESSVKTIAESAGKQTLDQARLQLLMSGQIKPDATEQEADKKLEELLGKTKDQYILEKTQEIVDKFKDPASTSEVTEGLLPMAVLNSIAKAMSYTEDDLKKSFEQLQLDVVRFDEAGKGPTEREAAAVKALEAIKLGKSFEAVQKEANPKAKPEDLKSELTRGSIESDKSLAPLSQLKVGEVSAVVTSFGSPTIYRLKAIKPNLPKDYEANKVQLIENAKQQKASTQLSDDLEARTKALKLEFKDLGIKAIYEAYTVLTDPEAQKDAKAFRERVAQMRSEVALTDLSKASPNLVALAEFALTEQLYTSGTADQKKELLDARVETAERALGFGEDLGLRIDLAKELIGAKKGDQAFTFLLAAAQNNADTENAGAGIYSQITQMNSVALNDKTFTKEQHDQIQKELDRWLDDKARRMKEDAEIKAASEKANKELDAEVEKAKKEQEKAGSKAAPPTTGTTGK